MTCVRYAEGLFDLVKLENCRENDNVAQLYIVVIIFQLIGRLLYIEFLFPTTVITTNTFH